MKTPLFIARFPDGCNLLIEGQSPNGSVAWSLEFPGGLAATCPHGGRATFKPKAQQEPAEVREREALNGK